LIEGVTFPDLGTVTLLKGETSESGAASSAALKNNLAGRLGDLLTVRLVDVLSPEKLLLEVAGTEVVAKGSAPPGATGLFTVRLESLEPLLQFSLVEQTDAGLPLQSSRLLRDLIANPNLFAKNISLLKELLLDGTIRLPASMLGSLKSLTSRFSAATLISDLRSGEGLPLKQLGLFHEQELAALLSGGAEKLSLAAVRQPVTVKADLLQLLVQLHGGFADELLPEGGPDAKLVAKLQTGLRSLLDMVELNQYLNNPGLRSEDDLILLLPLWGWGSVADLWLRLTRDRGEAKTSAGNLYTMMLYLDLEGLGPLGAQVVVGSQELQVKLLVVGGESAQCVRELLPETRKQLRSRFPDGVGLAVETVGPNGVEAFRQRAFLASLPPLFTASG
jgi:hypothetical protein